MMADKDIAKDLQISKDGNEDESQVEITEDSKDSQPEKMLPVSRVTELVKKAKYDGERKMQEQLEAAQKKIEQLEGQQPQQPVQQPAPENTNPGVDPAKIQEQVMQLMQQKMQEDEQKRYQEQLEQEVNEVAQNYFGKLAKGKDLYDDFDAVTADFDATAFPQLVYLATQMDNTAAIIYELQKNPTKLTHLASLVEKSPNMAKKQIEALSQSISQNEQAKNNEQAVQEPLNRMKPSPVGTDNGSRSVRDFKSSPFLRG